MDVQQSKEGGERGKVDERVREGETKEKRKGEGLEKLKGEKGKEEEEDSRGKTEE